MKIVIMIIITLAWWTLAVYCKAQVLNGFYWIKLGLHCTALHCWWLFSVHSVILSCRHSRRCCCCCDCCCCCMKYFISFAVSKCIYNVRFATYTIIDNSVRVPVLVHSTLNGLIPMFLHPAIVCVCWPIWLRPRTEMNFLWTFSV